MKKLRDGRQNRTKLKSTLLKTPLTLTKMKLAWYASELEKVKSIRAFLKELYIELLEIKHDFCSPSNILASKKIIEENTCFCQFDSSADYKSRKLMFKYIKARCYCELSEVLCDEFTCLQLEIDSIDSNTSSALTQTKEMLHAIYKNVSDHAFPIDTDLSVESKDAKLLSDIRACLEIMASNDTENVPASEGPIFDAEKVLRKLSKQMSISNDPFISESKSLFRLYINKAREYLAEAETQIARH